MLKRIDDWLDGKCPGWALGLAARFSGARHAIAGHKVVWRRGFDLWTGFLGFIECDDCPETSIDVEGKHCGLSIWGRQSRLVGFLGQVACCLLGHPAFQHPKQLDRFAGHRGRSTECQEDVEPDGAMVYRTDQWHCVRCCYSFYMHESWADAEATRKGK